MKDEEKETPDREAAGTFQLTDEEFKRLIARIDEQRKAYLESVEDEPTPSCLRRNLAGLYENARYPPNLDAYGSYCGGYPTNAQECFFYYFAVMGYDLVFRYHGSSWHLKWRGYSRAKMCEVMPDGSEVLRGEAAPNDMIERFPLDGRPLIEVMEELEDLDPC